MDAVVGFLGSNDPERLDRMSSRLAHRGSASEQGSITSGVASAARLSLQQEGVVGLDVGPRVLSTDRYALILCGYVTRHTLPMHGSTNLLSSIAEEFHQHRAASLSKIQGAFVILIEDRQQGTLTLARDGAGVRTAFYGRVADDWLIASEPKAITGEEGFRAKIRSAAIAQYLSFSFTPGEGTMLEDLYEVPCGYAVTLRRGQAPVLTSFFDFEAEEPDNIDASSGDMDPEDEQHWVNRTREVVSAAVRDRLPKGEPVGVFLSGGLDSSVIAAEVAAQHDGRVISYAIHFGDKYPNELEFARAVADRVGTEHHEVLVRPQDFLPRLREMVWHLDEPIGDPITQPNFELARRVSQDVRFVFNGEGGDPLFGGPKNIPMMLQHWYGVHRDERFREKAYLASYRRAYEECSRVLTDDVQSQIDPKSDLESVLSPFFDSEKPSAFLNKLMSINIRLKGAHLILPKVERMLAASGLTPLAPLFDEELIRLSFQMPPRMKLQKGIEKWALKRAYEFDLPREVIDRPKSGMRVPVYFWFQGEMRRRARKILSSRKVKNAGIFDPARVKQLLRYDTDEGPGRYGMRLWMLMTFEIWRQIVVEGESP